MEARPQPFRGAHGRSANGSPVATYSYNGDGLRTQKKLANDDTVVYHIIDGTYVGETATLGENTYYTTLYLRDDKGSVIGLQSNGSTYYFAKNLQGDVIAIYDASKTVVAKYVYDVWGKLISVTDASGNYITDPTHIALRNPFRYRGYMYDEETGLYYLRSRYYDPTTSRFINADGLVSTGTGIMGHNMFAYCNDNPVNYVDKNGTDPEAVAVWMSTMWWLCAADTVLPIGDIIYGVGILILGTIALTTIVEPVTLPQITFEEEGKTEPEKPNVPYPGDDPTKPPDEGFEWKGPKPEGGDKGSWVNPNTGEQYHPDLNHEPPIGPHYDYTDGSRPKHWWRIYPNGNVDLKY